MIGASAGGVETLARLVGALAEDLPAAILAVLHLSPASPSALPAILSRAGPLEAVAAEDGMAIEARRVYVAPPDRHMLIQNGRVRVVRGPRENHHRPAIDPLFRSAALVYGPRVVGVILSGTLDDGSAGIRAVKARGGAAIVQDPADALYPAMPENAIAADHPEHVVPLAEIPPLLERLARSPLPAGGDDVPVTGELDWETEMARFGLDAIEAADRPGAVSPFSCPECSGSLWQLDDEVVRFRCRVGHAYAAESLMLGQSEVVDRALWSALRALEERASLARRMADRLEAGKPERARSRSARYREQAKEAEEHATVIRDLLAGRREPVG